MRIENPTNRNSSSNFQKKEKHKKKNKEQTKDKQNSDSLDLSSAIILLNKLLEEPGHQYKPVPFYFPHATARNTRHAANIVKSIRQKALLEDVTLNPDMILDIIMSHSNEKLNTNQQIQSTRPENSGSYQHIILKEFESILFEKMYHTFMDKQLSTDIIPALVVEYFKLTRTKNTQPSNEPEASKQLKAAITNSKSPNINKHQTEILQTLILLQLEK